MDIGTAIAIGTATGNPGLGFALAYGDDTEYYTGDSPKLSFQGVVKRELVSSIFDICNSSPDSILLYRGGI
jgi:hypothetical protein